MSVVRQDEHQLQNSLCNTIERRLDQFNQSAETIDVVYMNAYLELPAINADNYAFLYP